MYATTCEGCHRRIELATDGDGVVVEYDYGTVRKHECRRNDVAIHPDTISVGESDHYREMVRSLMVVHGLSPGQIFKRAGLADLRGRSGRGSHGAQLVVDTVHGRPQREVYVAVERLHRECEKERKKREERQEQTMAKIKGAREKLVAYLQEHGPVSITRIADEVPGAGRVLVHQMLAEGALREVTGGPMGRGYTRIISLPPSTRSAEPAWGNGKDRGPEGEPVQHAPPAVQDALVVHAGGTRAGLARDEHEAEERELAGAATEEVTVITPADVGEMHDRLLAREEERRAKLSPPRRPVPEPTWDDVRTKLMEASDLIQQIMAHVEIPDGTPKSVVNVIRGEYQRKYDLVLKLIESEME